VSDETVGGDGWRSLTLTNIRRNQQKWSVDTALSSSPGRDRAALPLRRGGDDGTTSPSSPRTSATSGATCLTARDGPRYPPGATEQQQQLQARRDARELAHPTNLDLFRSCSDVEAAAVNPEADIRPGLGDDAVES
jgi:hypothetical protein